MKRLLRLAALALALGLAACTRSGEDRQQLLEAAARRVEAGTAVLIDVREPGERKSGEAGPALLLPASDLLGDRRQWKPFLAAHKDKELILYCASGLRSGQAVIRLKKEGLNATNLGSLRRWTSAGLPTRTA